MDYCKLVDVFHGCDEITPKKPEGIAAKWFFIKAGCGNTNPAATVPFGAISVGPFSGGYPTGYLDHCPNSHSRPPRFKEGKNLIGFAHMHQSGTGAIGYYYNYAVVSPKYDHSELYRRPLDEYAVPGYYSVTLEDIKCELTSNGRCAFHRYTFGGKNGYISVNFNNNGLIIPGNRPAELKVLYVRNIDNNTVEAKAEIEGIDIYFAVKADVKLYADGTTAVTENNIDSAELRVSISPKCRENALAHLSYDKFDDIRKNAYDKWNDVLSRIKIKTDDEEITGIFYSNLYHSLVKPSDWSGDSFIYDSADDFAVDLNTLWDMYKTEMPLLFMSYKEISDKVIETLLSFGEKLGFLPISIGIADNYRLFADQARMLGEYVLITALRYGYKIDIDRLMNVIVKDVFSPGKNDFIETGKCVSNTFVLDMADGCAISAQVAKENGYNDIYDKLYPLSKRWINAYSKETGLLSDDSSYYEGTLYNYSFRQMVEMDKRIELAGGQKRFAGLLDNFFGYGAEDTVQPTDPFNYEPVEEGMKLGRFEGFNNESDTEAPFSYIYADRHDRTCEIIRAGMEYMFTSGPGGIPGNNDTGALSSYYVFAALGIFPVAGQDLFLIGSPFIDSAEIELFNGKTLKVKVNNNQKSNIYVKSVLFNGKAISGYRITASEMFEGGELEFTMTDNKEI